MHAVVGQYHRTRALRSWQGGVANATVLGHAVDLNEVKSQLVVPTQQIGRHRRSTAGRKGALLQPQCGQDLLSDDAPEDGNLQQPVELGRRHLHADALLELDPQTRHAEKDRGARTLQVLGEGFQAFSEVDVHAGGQLPMLDQRPLGHVRQRQVAQHCAHRH